MAKNKNLRSFVWGESRAPLKTKTVTKTRPICTDPAGWRIFAVSWLPLQNLLRLSATLPSGPMPIAFFLQRQHKTKKFCYANEQGDHIKRCSYNSTTEEKKKKLTWAVGFVVVGHLEGMSVVENLTAVAGVVLQGERLQRPVERCFCDVNGRLAGSVGNRVSTNPCTWSFKIIWRKIN